MAGSNEVNANESRRVVPLNTWVLISNFKVAYNMLRHSDGTFDRHLAEFLERKVLANRTPVNGVLSFDITLDRPTGLHARIYRPSLPSSPSFPNLYLRPSSSSPFPVILFFHGGSFAHSSANTAIYDSLCRRLVSLVGPSVVISVNYRRSPEHRYPAAYDDGWTALKWASEESWLRYDSDSKPRIFLAGDSSGGNIAHNVALQAADEGIEISGNILLNPMFGGIERTESERRLDGKYFVTIQDRDWYWKAFLPEGADRDHPACNPFGPNGVKLEEVKFPKSLLVVAGLDLLQDWALAYAEGLKMAGKDVKLVYRERATVGFYFLPNTEHYYEVMDEIKTFVTSNC